MKTRQIVLQIPTISIDYSSYFKRHLYYFRDFSQVVKEKCLGICLSVTNFFKKRTETNYSGDNFRREMRREMRLKSFFYKNKKIFRNLFILIISLSLFLLVTRVLSNSSNKNASDTRVEVKDALFAVDVNKEFGFPLKDADGEEVSKIKYLIEKAELRDEIITEGKRATAVKGRMFLILVLKIANQYEKPIEINTRDYVRLSVNGKEEDLLAPDTHNDPVEIQAISTKYTRIGFIINDSDKDYILHVGEIQGDKEKINLDLK
jgi:hypothetical protein